MENMASRSLLIFYIFVLRTEKVTIFEANLARMFNMRAGFATAPQDAWCCVKCSNSRTDHTLTLCKLCCLIDQFKLKVLCLFQVLLFQTTKTKDRKEKINFNKKNPAQEAFHSLLFTTVRTRNGVAGKVFPIAGHGVHRRT